MNIDLKTWKVVRGNYMMFYKKTSSKTEYAELIQCFICLAALGTHSIEIVIQQTFWLGGSPT